MLTSIPRRPNGEEAKIPQYRQRERESSRASGSEGSSGHWPPTKVTQFNAWQLEEDPERQKYRKIIGQARREIQMYGTATPELRRVIQELAEGIEEFEFKEDFVDLFKEIKITERIK